MPPSARRWQSSPLTLSGFRGGPNRPSTSRVRGSSHSYRCPGRDSIGSDRTGTSRTQTGRYKCPVHVDDRNVNVDAYWGYWLDGEGSTARLRLNMRHAAFTKVRARQFALHEVLGHALQCASLAEQCASYDVPWVRVMSVHARQQVNAEGLAQALPLFVVPDDPAVVARVRLDQYTQLVRAHIHIALNSGTSSRNACTTHERTCRIGRMRILRIY